MELFTTAVLTVIGAALGWGIGLVLRPLMHRKHWQSLGREDALLPYPYRFVPTRKWLRKYYDEGYEQGLREKDEA